MNIDSEGYDQYFGGTSPLDRAKLSCAITKLLELRPAVIVVDFDTASQKFAGMDSGGERIVWARDAVVSSEGRMKALDVLGRAEMPPMWGLALLPRNPDWTIREYPRYLLSNDNRWLPTLHWAAVEAYCRVTASTNCPVLNFRPGLADKAGVLSLQVFHSQYDFEPFYLQQFVKADGAASPVCVAAWGDRTPANDNPLHDKIVFLGGSYTAGDRHPTPFGTKAGIELVASATEAEFDPSKPGQVTGWLTYLLKILLAIVVVACHHYLKPRYALIAIVGVLGFMVFFGSFAAFYVTAYRANFVPFVIGLWIEQLYEGAEKAHEHAQRISKSG